MSEAFFVAGGFCEEVDEDLRRESMDERRRNRRMSAWCGECMSNGHRAGCPEAPEEDEPAPEDDSPYCECNAQPTINELEDGRCDACGKELR